MKSYLYSGSCLLAIVVPSLTYAACVETGSGITANNGSNCLSTLISYTQTSINTPVMRATGNNTRITVDLSTSINNTLASPGDVGLNAVNNGVIDLNNFITILTGRSTGNTRGANALIATNGGRININAGANITTEGTSLAANGVQRNNGLSVELDQANSSQITTYGLVRLEVNGRDSRAVNATGNNTNGITINDDIDIVVRGTNIRAFHANDGARIIANGLTTVRHEGISDSDAGTPSIGIYATETPQGAGSINLNDLELTTLEDGVPGVVANSFFGLSIPTINLNGKARITTLGARANAVVALNGGRVSMNEGHILANGEGSIALLANLDNSQISLNSGTAFGKQHALNMTSGSQQQVTLANVTLSATDAAIIHVSNSLNANLSLQNSIVQAANAQPTLQVEGNSSLTSVIQNSTLAGLILIDNTANANISLLNQTRFTGQISGGQYILDDSSQWQMTASSRVQNLDHFGAIYMQPSTQNFKELVVTNTYIGHDGQLYLNTYLGSPTTASDRLTIDGGQGLGRTILHIHNLSASAAPTVANGIKVVNAINGGRTAENAFSLANPIVVGPYRYTLYRGGIDNSDIDSWFLRNTLPGGVLPDYRSEVSLYTALSSALLQYSQKTIGTYHRRYGNQTAFLGATMPLSTQLKPSGTWLRLYRDKEQVNNGGLFKRGPNYHSQNNFIQIGSDVMRFKTTDDELLSGFSFSIGDNQSTVRHTDASKAGKNKATAWGFGWYLTKYRPQSYYLDAVIEVDFFKPRVRSSASQLSSPNWHGLAGSLEAGYTAFQQKNWQIEPQVQLITQILPGVHAHDDLSQIHFKTSHLLTSRLALQASWTPREPTTSTIFWLTPYVMNQAGGKAYTLFDNVSCSSNIQGTKFGADIGLSYPLAKQAYVYANVFGDESFKGHLKSYGGLIGVRSYL